MAKTTAIRGPVLTYTGDPFKNSVNDTLIYESDAIVAMADGVITHFGPPDRVVPQLPAGTEVKNYGKDSLISAGFIDSHVHFPQTPMIAAYGEQLLDWLNKYTFPTEQRYSDKEFARSVAKVFLQENLRNGITCGCVYCTVYPQSVDALFEEAAKLGMRLAAGKVMMDRNAPEKLLDTPQRGYDESKALIKAWHNRGRLMYAITPRFAPTSTREQLEATGALCKEHPECYMQTHVSENKGEVAWVKELFPERKGYLDVYDHYFLCRPRAVFGHGIHLTDDEMEVMHRTGSAIAHCPTSNFFLGSGYFNIAWAMKQERPVRVGLGTDLGCRHLILHPRNIERSLRSRATQQLCAFSKPRLLRGNTRDGTRHVSGGQDRKHRAGHGSRHRRARHEIDAHHRIPDAVCQGPRRGSVHPNDAR
jgi:guanine deaminase